MRFTIDDKQTKDQDRNKDIGQLDKYQDQSQVYVQKYKFWLDSVYL